MIKQTYLTNNDCYKNGRWIVPQGIILHSVGSPYSSAQGFVDYWNKPNFDRCVHAFIDSNNGDVYQTLPWAYRGWHAGGSANNTHIGVEMCESEFLKYKPNSAEFTVDPKDKSKAQAQIILAYHSAVCLFADLCARFGLDPEKDGVILSHREAGQRGIASGHVDPEHVWIGLNLPFTMDAFRKDVKNKMRHPFVDVAPGSWYADAVQWCYENGIINGVDETHFKPDKMATRAELATIIYRLYCHIAK